jgi:FKBP-type peptidyl-prolyl cis-trans isomerase 2
VPTESPSVGLLVFLAVIVVVVAAVGGGLLYYANHPKPAATAETVAVGDNVTVNYIGFFGSGPELGKVFDTSIQSVATNNATYPKSLEYSPRNASGYVPLPVHVGPRTPSGGYNVSGTVYGGVVTGFWQGLVGLKLNQTHDITVSPSAGYGALNTSCLVTSNLSQTVPVYVYDTPSQFASAYPGVSAVSGTTFSDPTYGWTDDVVSANASIVVVQRQPTAGTVVAPYGWDELVRNVTATSITLVSELTPASVGSVLGSEPNTTVCSTTKFLVWSVDLSAGTFVENYNSEVTGETLIFQVTVESILPP